MNSVEGLKEYKVSKFKDQDGPRHIAFNNGEYAIVHELSNYVSVANKMVNLKNSERHLTVLKILMMTLN